MTTNPNTKLRASAIAMLLLVGLPLIIVFLAGPLTLLFYALGYRHEAGRVNAPSIVAIVVGTRLVLAFRQHLSKPSKPILYAALACWGIIAILILARLTHRLPAL